MEWFYAVNNEQKGPVSSAQLKALRADLIITDDSLVWHDEMANWAPFSSIAADLEADALAGDSIIPLKQETAAEEHTAAPEQAASFSLDIDSEPENADAADSEVDLIDWGPCEFGNIWNRGWAVFSERMSQFLIGAVVCFGVLSALSVLQEGVNLAAEYHAAVVLITGLGGAWAQTLITLGLLKYYLDVLDYGEGSLESFYAYPVQAISLTIAWFLIGIAGFLGLLLLVVPGVYIFCRCMLASTYCADEEIGGFEAMSKCWDESGPYVPQLFLVGLAQIVLIFVGFIMLCFGVIFTGSLAAVLLVVTYRTICPKTV